MNLYTGPTNKIGFFHWAYDTGSLTPNQQTGITINTATDYTARFEYRYFDASTRILRSYLNNALQLTSVELFSGSDLNYDIWYQDVCPCNDKQAYFALNTFEGDVTYNDLKGWQLHDGTTSERGRTNPPSGVDGHGATDGRTGGHLYHRQIVPRLCA